MTTYPTPALAVRQWWVGVAQKISPTTDNSSWAKSLGLVDELFVEEVFNVIV